MTEVIDIGLMALTCTAILAAVWQSARLSERSTDLRYARARIVNQDERIDSLIEERNRAEDKIEAVKEMLDASERA